MVVVTIVVIAIIAVTMAAIATNFAFSSQF
jgi:hypothetical protein